MGTNLFIFAFLVCIVYVLYKRRRGGRQRAAVSYKRVEVTTAAERKDRVNVLVTGGIGCLGKSLVKFLLDDGGYNVHSLDLWIPKEEHRNPKVCSYIQTDITNLDDLILAFKGVGAVDAVFHTAAITPMDCLYFSDDDFHRHNLTGTKNVIEACKECAVKRLVHTSSITVVLSKDPAQCVNGVDETFPIPKDSLNAYTSSKATAEKFVRAANGNNGLVTCVLRLAAIFSSDNPLVKFLLSNRAFYPGDGLFGYSIVPVEAAVRGHILAEKKLREGEDSIVAGKAYNMCMEDKIPFRELNGYSANSKGPTIWGTPPPIALPIWLFVVVTYVNAFGFWLIKTAPIDPLLGPMCLDFFREHTFTSALAHKELGWEELPPWQEIVKELVKKNRETKKEK